MPRLFSALALPPEVAQVLAGLQGGVPGARWIEPDQYHLTLRFIGDVDGPLAEDVMSVMAECRSRPPVAIVVEGLSAFGRDRPRALVALASPSAELMELQAEQERLARRAGLDPETRRFTPHVTLARLSREASPAHVATYISAHAPFTPLSFTADAFGIYSAKARTGGGPYLLEAGFPFD